MASFPLTRARELPVWRRPVALLFLMAMAMPVAFATWSALLNNFVIEVAGFDGVDIGTLHTVREIPGFLAIAVILLLILFHEQTLALVSLALLGIATALTAQFPSMAGILTITLLSSIGFHYYETVNQSLQLQWIDKARAPQTLGLLLAAGSGATFIAYVLIVLTWEALGLTYSHVYWVSGGFTALAALYAYLAFPRFEAPNPQRRELVLRRRYWLYYALQFLAGARRQIFIVFAGFMMVERFGMQVHEITALYLGTLVVNVVTAPLVGRAVARWGEGRALAVEYAALGTIFLAYGGIYWFDWGIGVGMALYVANHIFFALALALKTYFQKIADPSDIAPTAAVAFTINHVAAVGLPIPLGLLWLISPDLVFLAAAGIALASLALSLLVPRHPVPGRETRLSGAMPQPAE
ncbi:MAG: MFS transporter [Hasllibacter sp.]